VSLFSAGDVETLSLQIRTCREWQVRIKLIYEGVLHVCVNENDAKDHPFVIFSTSAPCNAQKTQSSQPPPAHNHSSQLPREHKQDDEQSSHIAVVYPHTRSQNINSTTTMKLKDLTCSPYLKTEVCSCWFSSHPGTPQLPFPAPAFLGIALGSEKPFL
jgi:hypothetical protein